MLSNTEIHITCGIDERNTLVHVVKMGIVPGGGTLI